MLTLTFAIAGTYYNYPPVSRAHQGYLSFTFPLVATFWPARADMQVAWSILSGLCR